MSAGNRERTHWHGCWREHLGCAQVRIQKLTLAAREAENALLDYVPTLERQGGSMNYGRTVLRLLHAALGDDSEQPRDGKDAR